MDIQVLIIFGRLKLLAISEQPEPVAIFGASINNGAFKPYPAAVAL